MLSLIVQTIIFVIAITLTSFIFKRIEKRMLFPIALVLMSTVLFFISFKIGEWTGIRLGAISVSLFIASIISLITISLVYIINTDGSKTIK